ncbi:MAG TPA: uroporphyrinogen decarboxylase family protein [Armatimonadota bacterium]|nr:uroporphyrinogen decarboxylase family protein [Armatimonadota bacterium]
MTSREIITRVLNFDNPPRIGFTYSHFQGKSRLADTAGVGPKADPEFEEKRWFDDRGGEQWTDEWGCTWRRIVGRTIGGEVVDPPIRTWDDLDTYQPPSLDDPGRYEQGPEVREKYADKYLLGGITGACFNRARYLRTFEGYLQDCAGEPEMIERLNRMVSDIVLAQVDIYGDIGCDGVSFCEDWGTQERLLVSPKMWDRMFKWTFERLIERAHKRNMTVWMHSCGYVRDIVPPLVELGMDVFQFDQPEVHGIDNLADYHGRCSFWLPVDIQKILPMGDEGVIRYRAREYVEKLGTGGGLIAKDYGDNKSIGADPLWQHWGYEEFKKAGVFDASQSALDASEL